ncbi:TatA/E family twin arginine-targeting protein translocase [Sodalinema gerasimenkoae]|uniref:TatA/E family twin arginine-targeting protein translocase n=1 Tax=Sodalinema gerasimenkoae TaxID=2862348 RepID=UPI00135CBFA7|nr:TatA/E family twin arginine-targeting protein translocase [Sodalinema gerasimenkoae]
MNIFGIGLPEAIVILVIALLIFGPKKLPEIGSSLGKAIRSFQDASKEFENEFKRESEQLKAQPKREMSEAAATPSASESAPSTTAAANSANSANSNSQESAT